MAKGEYYTSSFYSEPSYKFKPSKDIPQVGYSMKAGELGLAIDPRTANQIAMLSQALNAGIVPVEVGVLSPETFDAIPKQHFEEMRRKAKLAEAKISMHAPLVEPSGFTQQGWDESSQKSAERQLMEVMDKAAMLDDKDNVPVTIHSSGGAGSTYTFEKDEKTGKRVKVAEQLVVVNRETGQMTAAKAETKYYARTGAKEIKTSPEKHIEVMNSTDWDNEIDKVVFNKESASKILSNVPQEGFLIYNEAKNNPQSQLGPNERNLVLNIDVAAAHLKNAEMALNSAFNKVYKYSDAEEKKQLAELSKQYARELYGGVDPSRLVNNGRNLSETERRAVESAQLDLTHQANSLQSFAEILRNNFSPKIYQTVEEFSIDKASKTFANVAMHTYEAYEKKGKASPIISIEHLPAGMAFSQAGDLKKLVEKSQEEFKNKLIEKERLSEFQADKVARKLIGATFDVGHININKKHGFTDEDIRKEAAEIAKHVKHVHLTDNFGYSDSHLPIGMGNVPIKEIMEEFEKQGVKTRKINEVGGWFEHFKTNPYAQILEAAGSPIYDSGAGPYWSQRTGFIQNYNAGYGMMLPSINYETFGAGFSRLPQELGGSVQQGGGGRMGGGGF